VKPLGVLTSFLSTIYTTFLYPLWVAIQSINFSVHEVMTCCFEDDRIHTSLKAIGGKYRRRKSDGRINDQKHNDICPKMSLCF